MKKTMYIIRGPSGAGKSTYISKRLLGQGSQAIVCSADDFFIEERPNPENPGHDSIREYKFDVAKLTRAHQWCLNQVLQALIRNTEIVVVDNTHTQRWEYENYELAGRLAGYKVEIVEIVPESLEEMRMCAVRNSHGVPAAVVAGHCMRFEHDTRAVRVTVNDNHWQYTK